MSSLSLNELIMKRRFRRSSSVLSLGHNEFSAYEKLLVSGPDPNLLTTRPIAVCPMIGMPPVPKIRAGRMFFDIGYFKLWSAHLRLLYFSMCDCESRSGSSE
ncbi:hypothetical protein X777_08498 [Ooceraea biroi]|uniref:Uncharacterized protein n=1 Tax=Ooceraea biroi TaxID=2015173 RepID=A0A026W9Y6_OOCBI|nr:hypothetical protein X777_08498 [Ooceraea biroi]